MTHDAESTYGFLLDMYETEILKICGIWSAFPEPAMAYQPHAKSRTVMEQMEHQLESEGRWMKTMLDIDTGSPNPAERTQRGFIDKYREDATRRLEIMRSKDDEYWRQNVEFFDVTRSRAWVLARRINHSTHHRGQLVVYLRLLDIPVTSVYGPTADTGGAVRYSLPRKPTG